MNERVVKMGDQLKGAFTKITATWKEQEPVKKRRIGIIAGAVVLLAIAVAVVLNMVNGRYVVLYDNITQDESVQAVGILQAAEIAARVNGEGKLEVPSKDIYTAMAQLSIQGIPSSTPDYSITDAATGLTTTEFEKQTAWTHQQQNRMQEAIKTYQGVQSAIVTLNIQEESNRVWDAQATTNTGSVQVTMKPGFILGAGQVEGIRHMVGSAVGIDPSEVTVTDGELNMLAAAGESYNAAAAVTENFLERMNLENEAEQNLMNKAATVLSLPYPNAVDWRISCKVTLDFDAMMTEIKEYQPLEGTDHGVLDQEEIDAVLGMGQYAEGVVGETDNTDVPIYVDYDGDAAADSVDFHRSRDYAVSYVLEQIEKDGPSVAAASMAVVINDAANNDKMQSLRTAIAQATGLAVDNVTVQNYLVESPADELIPPWYESIFGEGFDPMLIYIALGVLVLLIVVLVLVMILRSRAKKKRIALEMAEAVAEQEEADRIQQEIEQRKLELKNAAIGEQQNNAITEEVREFSRNNPEITANLLRNWLKEGE